MRDYKKYDVYKNAHDLVLMVYNQIVVQMPETGRYGLTNQLRRGAYSIPINIVEGCGKHTDKDFARFLDNALGSAQELEYILTLATNLNFLNITTLTIVQQQIGIVKAQLINLIKSLR